MWMIKKKKSTEENKITYTIVTIYFIVWCVYIIYMAEKRKTASILFNNNILCSKGSSLNATPRDVDTEMIFSPMFSNCVKYWWNIFIILLWFPDVYHNTYTMIIICEKYARCTYRNACTAWSVNKYFIIIFFSVQYS